MPIEFRCPQCGRLLQAGSDTAGHRVLCPGCAAFCEVPGPAAAEPDRVPMFEGPAEPQESAPPAVESGSPFGIPPAGPADDQNPYAAPTQYGPPPPPELYRGPATRTDARAAVSLGLGVGGLAFSCMCFPPMGIVLGAIGLMLGIMARRTQSRAMAIAGIVLCSIQLVLGLGYIALIVVMLVSGNM